MTSLTSGLGLGSNCEKQLVRSIGAILAPRHHHTSPRLAKSLSDSECARTSEVPKVDYLDTEVPKLLR